MFVPLSVLEFRDRAAMYFGDKIGVIDGDTVHLPGMGRAHAPAGQRARRARRGTRRPRLVRHLQHAPPARGLLRGARGRRRPQPRQHPPDAARDRLHPRPRRLARRLLPPRLHAAGRGDRTAADERGRASSSWTASPVASPTTSTRRSSPAGRPSRAIPQIDENAMAELFYTSGTTGLPKGVALTHRELYLHAMSAQVALGFTEDDVVLHVVPALPRQRLGRAALPDHDRRAARHAPPLRPGRAHGAWCERHRVTRLLAVPTIFNAVLHHRERSTLRPVEPAPADHRRLARVAGARPRARGGARRRRRWSATA